MISHRRLRRAWILPGVVVLTFPLIAVGAAAPPTPQARIDAGTPTALPTAAADVFRTDRIWTAHFTVAADQWALMQPRPLKAGETPRNGVAGALTLDEVHADLEFEGALFRNIGLRFKGNGTLLNSIGTKMPLKADLNQNVKGQKLAGLTTLNFHNNVWDPTGTNEMLAYGLFRAVGVAAPRVGYARVYLTIPGKYNRLYSGLYSIVEDVDSHFTADRFGGAGAIFKPVAANFFSYHGPNWADYAREWDPKSDLTAAQKQRVIDFVSFVAFASDAEFVAHIGTFVDIDTFARQMAVSVWVSNLDGPPNNGQNLYMYLDPQTNRFITIPWDQDDAWGGIFQTQDIRNTVNIFRPWTTPHTFILRAFGLDTFKKTYLMHPRIAELLAFLAENHDVLTRAVDSVPSHLRETRPAANRWSVAEVIGHLAIVEGRTGATLSNAIARAAEKGLGPELSTEPVISAEDVKRIMDRSRQIETPDTARPPFSIKADAAWQSLSESHELLRTMLGAADGLALGEVVVPHPVLGPLSVYSWVVFIGGHEARHAAQIDELRLQLGQG